MWGLLIIVLIVLYVAFACFRAIQKYNNILFEANEWLELKDSKALNSYNQYIRLDECIRESSEWFSGYHYFEPDGKIKHDTLSSSRIVDLYQKVQCFKHLGYKLADKLEEAFQMQTNADEVAERKAQEVMRKNALRLFLNEKKSRG